MSTRSKILLGLGISCAITIVPFTAQAAISSYKKIEAAKCENDNLSFKDKFIIVWKDWIPPIGMLGLSIASFCVSNYDLKKHEIAAVAAYNVAQTSYDVYKKKVIEKFGENVHEEMKKDIAIDAINKTPEYERAGSVIFNETGNGDVPCFDIVRGVYFRSSPDAIKRAIIQLDREIIDTGWASVNDLYYLLGINLPKDSSFWDNMGFNRDDIEFTTKPKVSEIDIDSVLAGDGVQYITINYEPEPIL